MLNWFLRHGSHAIEPVLGTKAVHSPKECEYCAQKLKNQVHHIHPNVPLEYQNFSATNITRFAVSICSNPELSHSAHGKTMSDVLKNGFQCRIIRQLDVHQLTTIQPTRENIQSELKHLSVALKRNDRLVIYLNTDQTDILQHLFNLITDKHVFVWIISTSILTIPKEKSKLKACLLCPSLTEKEFEFTERLLDVLSRTRYRTTVTTILSEMLGSATFTSNYFIDNKNTYFGFG